jgi:hypothetical protein
VKKAFIVSFLFFVLLSCNNRNSSDTNKKTAAEKQVPDVIGKWKVIAVQSSQMEESTKKEAIESATMEFKPSGTYESVDHKQTFEGTYNFNEKNGDLTIYSSPSGHTDTTHLGIEWDSSKNMIMAFPGSDTRVTLRKLY